MAVIWNMEYRCEEYYAKSKSDQSQKAPYSRFLHSRFHYSRIEKMRPNSHIRGLRFLYSRIESKYRNVSPITPYKLPFHIHGFCIRGIFTERIPRE
ncbi:hypothetical protein SFRURICE_008624 [Spodoptera frugiperda]|nr:hypothetical protein SFRURICE_008624 [Spodoptera frugiperda]